MHILPVPDTVMLICLTQVDGIGGRGGVKLGTEGGGRRESEGCFVFQVSS